MASACPRDAHQIVEKLNQEINSALADPRFKTRLADTVIALLAEMPPGAIGPGTITQACRTAQRQVLKGEVRLGGPRENVIRPEVQRKGARF
jgi:hypothetical protein